MCTFNFASSVRLFLQTMAPLSWQRTIPKNICPSCNNVVQLYELFHNGFLPIITICFENFYDKLFETLIWDIGKSTFFKNTIRNVIILIIKTLKFYFFELWWRQCRQGNYCFYDLFFHCEEALTFFKFENVY